MNPETPRDPEKRESSELDARRAKLSPEKRALLEKRLRGLSDAAAEVASAGPAETRPEAVAAAPLPDLAPLLFAGEPGVSPVPDDVWRTLVEIGFSEAASLAQLPELLKDATLEAWLDRQAAAIIGVVLARLGLFQQTGEEHSADELIRNQGILEKHRKVLRRWLETLADEGLLERRGGSYAALEPIPPPALAAVVPEEHRAYYGENLPKILDGSKHPLEFYLPDGASKSVEASYREQPIFRYCNGIAGAVFAAQAAALPEGRRLRVLEVGAGTGGTTASLLSHLPADRGIFLFTDVSKFFTDLGAKKFADSPVLHSRELDLERDPEAQGFPAGGFDWIVAAHVLHATKSIHTTLAHVRRLLAPGGVLLLLEEIRFQRKYHFTMGFLPGFDSFEDHDLRPFHPLLPAATWKRELLAHGFADFATFTEPGSAADVLGVDVMLARADSSAPEAWR
ncbi:MAG TPA: class I SAM-dependent methyltransferase [Thermoanaerobaculia bacterium]|nr:class I SAM-dependent methyltransferase [Thermoanaerobaculia bacterium]